MKEFANWTISALSEIFLLYVVHFRSMALNLEAWNFFPDIIVDKHLHDVCWSMFESIAIFLIPKFKLFCKLFFPFGASLEPIKCINTEDFCIQTNHITKTIICVASCNISWAASHPEIDILGFFCRNLEPTGFCAPARELVLSTGKLT